MSRQRFVWLAGTILASLFVALGAGSLHAKDTPNAPPYNVLLIIADDMRPDLGAYGDSSIQTPHLDRLAQQGMTFTRAYAQVAVCNPSRVVFLSGLRPETTGIYGNKKFLRQQLPEVVTLPQFFKGRGYTTVSVGKVFHHYTKHTQQPGNDPLSWSQPMQGSEAFLQAWQQKLSRDEVVAQHGLPEGRYRKSKRGPAFAAVDRPEEDFPDAQIASAAVQKLRELKDEPFFLAVGFDKPHLPFICPKTYWDLYPTDSIQLPPTGKPPVNAPAVALHDWQELRSYGLIPKKGPISQEVAVQLIRGYRACVSFTDAQVGRVMTELDRLGLRERTIVVFWGDHGYHLGEQGLWGKMSNFERATRVPLILSVPGQRTAGESCAALVEVVDIYPTLVALNDFAPPPGLEGVSLEPLLENPKRPWKKAAFSSFLRLATKPENRPQGNVLGRSIRTDRYRYTEWRDQAGTLVGRELYDQAQDPNETRNLVSRPNIAPVVTKLAEELQAGWKAALPPQ